MCVCVCVCVWCVCGVCVLVCVRVYVPVCGCVCVCVCVVCVVCVCVCVTLGTQHAMRMLHSVICDLPRSTIFFPHYLINGTIFGKKFIETKACCCMLYTVCCAAVCCILYALQLLSETFLILRRTERDIIKNVYRSACTVPVIVVLRL